MNKKNLAILLSILFLSAGCGEAEDISSNSAASEPGKIPYETDQFLISIPEDWEILEAKNFTSNVPEGTIVAFRSNIINENFTSNLNIINKNFEEEISVQDFEKSSLAKAKNSIIDFKEISAKDFEVAISEEENVNAVIAEFEGKRIASEPVIHFKQLYIVYKGTGYTITSAHLKTEDESIVKMLDEMLNSLALK